MLRKNKIKEKLHNGKPVLMFTLNNTDPAFGELYGMVGIEMVVIDTEHTDFTTEEVENQIRAIVAGGGEAIIRTTVHDLEVLEHYMEIGASGILSTATNCLEDARKLVDGTKYPPIGQRGIGRNSKACNYGLHDLSVGEYTKLANENTFLGAVIESKQGFDDLDEILKIEAIDSIHFGLEDLACSMGMPGDTGNPIIRKMVKEAREKVLKAGKYLSYGVSDPQAISALVESGATIIKLSSDLVVLRDWLMAYRRALDCVTVK